MHVTLVCAETSAVAIGTDGRLVYERDQLGSRIPDFSNCGYAGADRDIPNIPVRITVVPDEGDDGERIQAAIDAVGRLPLGNDGFRGAVLLATGTFEVSGQLRIAASGIVLRGSGAAAGGTKIIATGLDRRALMRIEGVAGHSRRGSKRFRVVDDYVAVGSKTLRLNSTEGLAVGDQVFVIRPSTADWIQTLGMDAFGVAWKPGTRDLRWDRTIARIQGNTVTFDAPITTALDQRYGGARVEPYSWPWRISNVGVEDLQMRSAYDAARAHDEDHAWFGIVIQNAQNAWVRRIEFRHFSGGAVALSENTKWVTIEDCVSLAPISEIGGSRRHTFFTQGQLTLFLRCWAELGRHDFAVGHCAAGPNAFVNCYGAEALADSGPIESWASGVLYDNVRIDGAGLNLQHRWISPPGAGWSAANCVLWQCQAATMHVVRPPTANNWAIGVWAGFSGDGTFQARSDFVKPISLYQAQLAERRGPRAAAHVELGLVSPIGSTNPTISQAAEFTAQSTQPARRLIDLIQEQFERATHIQIDKERRVIEAVAEPSPSPSQKETGSLAIENGWLVVNGALKTGGLIQQGFWRGTTRPYEAPFLGPAITRFVPGRVGFGFTDDLGQVAGKMLADDVAVFDHHYGLWYDRRRDDHTMVRQADGDVAPPFYEQPFARSGTGAAWDGLSKYDLTKFNPWYWQRLRNFVQLCDEHGLVLFHQNYFQHNILEAGAHWADCPWRPANNVNDTGLPEPPPYIGNKRIFMAQQFYDATDPRRRALHRAYIRQCLNNFSDCSNVVQTTSAEYSGPLAFTQFWIDTIIEWHHEQGRDVVIALSAPKDVQDAILADPIRSRHVDIIDIRYWAYTAGGELYAPNGGQNLAPRQHLRQTRQKSGGFAAIVRAVREYRTRYPEKAVTYYADMNCPSERNGWAVLMGGGSLPNVKLPDDLSQVIPTLRPSDGVVIGDGQWCLGRVGRDYLVYTTDAGGSLDLSLPSEPVRYRTRWIDTESGETRAGGDVTAGKPLQLEAKANVLWLERINNE